MANVTNADVDAAIALKYALDDIGSTSWSARSDHPANHPVPQAFAQHRTQATAELVAALKQASWLLADLSPDGLVKKAIDDVLSKYEER